MQLRVRGPVFADQRDLRAEPFDGEAPVERVQPDRAGQVAPRLAAADPAVLDPDAARNAVLAEPLWRVRGSAGAVSLKTDIPCETGCAGFDPLAWLKSLFAAESGDGAARPGGEVPAGTVTAPPAAAAETERRPAGPGAAALPAESAPVGDGPNGDDLRTDEVVARIWIAPFVDAGGVYREASHVRVVLEPAGWRLGR